MSGAIRNGRKDAPPWQALAAWRGLAAVVVACGHAVQIFVSPYLPVTFAGATLIAQAAVMVFFVISGFSIAAAARRSLSDAHPLLHYANHRAARILPPLLMALLLQALLASLAPLIFPSGTTRFLPQEGVARSGLDFNIVHAVGALLFLNGFVTSTPPGNGPLWSLSYEVWLYALYFLGLLAVVERRLYWAAGAALLLAALLWLDQSGSYFRFAKYGLVWMLGAAVYHVRTLAPDGRFTAARMLTVVAAVAVVLLGTQRLAYDGETDLIRFNLAVGACFAAWLLWLRDRTGGPTTRGARSATSGVGRLAGFGYTLYLIHYPVMLFVFGALQELHSQSWPRAAAIGLATLAVTIATARWMAKYAENRGFFLHSLNRLHARVAAKRP